VRLIMLTFALVLFLLAGLLPPVYENWRVRVVAFGLALYVASAYPWP
jgi:hypothetical protein